MHYNPVVYAATQVVGFFIDHILFRIETRYDAPLPRGPYVVVSNHLSNIDHGWIMSIPNGWFRFRKMHFLAKAAIFSNLPGRLYFSAMGEIPVHRGSREREPIDKAVKYLKQGEIVVVYPEGTTKRGLMTVLRRFKSGAALIALEGKVPVVPVAHTGGEDLLFRKVGRFGFRKVRMRIGTPMYFKEYYDRADDPEAVKEVTRQIQERVRDMYLGLTRESGWWAEAREAQEAGEARGARGAR